MIWKGDAAFATEDAASFAGDVHFARR